MWFEINLASQHEIAVKFDCLSLQSWGLSNRTLNALLSHNFKMTVGDVIRARDSLLTLRGLSRASIKELTTKVSQLLAENRNIQSQFSTAQFTIPSIPVAFVDPLPKLLSQSVQSLPLDQLI